MEIKYLGHSSFRIKGKQTVVITDPFDPAVVGLKFPVADADIITISHEHPDHNAISHVSLRGSDFLIARGPGEYERGGVKIFGFSTFHDNQKGAERGRNTMYQIEIDGMRILHAGDIGHLLADAALEKIDEIDILLVPTGGIYTIGEKEAVKFIRQIEPNIVIPMHYKCAGMSAEFAALSPVDAFISAIDKEPVRTQKLVISKDKLPEEMTVMVLES